LLPVTITPTIEFPIDKDFSVKQAIARGALLFSPISNPFQTSAINHMGFAGFTLKQGEKLIEQNTFIPALKKRSEKITVGEINLPDTFTEEISKFDKNRSSTLGNNSNHSTKGAINKRISEVQSEHDYRGQDTIDVVISPMRYFLEERWKTILMNKSS
jgi:nucleoid-associated protein YgaU